MPTPTQIRYGTVVGQFVSSSIDGTDTDGIPDISPLKGSVVFSAAPSYVLDYGTSPNPVTISTTQVACPLDSEGYLCTPPATPGGPLVRGVQLIATDNANITPSMWTWTVHFVLKNKQGRQVQIPIQYINVPSGATVDLTAVANIAKSNGTVITKGLKGDKGDKGDVGEQGIVGPKGDKGDTGDITPTLTSYRDQALESKDAAAASATLAGTHASGAALSEAAAIAAKNDAETAKAGTEAIVATTVSSGSVNASGNLILSRNDSTTLDAGYVVGPANTLTVIDTVTGPETPGATGPQGLKGDKGDPGGIVLGTVLTTTDLNLIVTSGVYRQDNSPNATLARNYPRDGVGGVLLVTERVASGATASVIQQYTPVISTTAGSPYIYTRYSTTNNTVWSPWRVFASTRVDQTAGRAIYQWDDLNNREQLVYGDTGWRDLATSLAVGFTGAAKVRRIGHTLEFSMENIAIPDSYTSGEIVFLTLPTGFIINGAWAYHAVRLKNSNQMLFVRAKGNQLALQTSATLTTTSNIVEWIGHASTLEAWPTTLPGTAVGSIPNL